MKKNKLFYFVILFSLMVTSSGVLAQTTGDFRSKATGNWSATGTWESYNGSVWGDAVAIPDLTQAITITIQSGHTVTVDASYTANNTALNIIVNGYLKETGIITKTAGIWTITGTYELNHISASGSGLPTATWNDGSTCSITGVTSSTTGINASQSFYHLVVNCPSMSASLNLGWNSGTITVRGNFTVSNTGSGRLQVCGPLAGTSGSPTTVTVNIGGNIIVDGSNAISTATGVILTSNGTSNNYTAITINVTGNVTVTGNSAANNAFTVFAVSKGSQGGTGTTVWNFSGDVNVTNAAMQNSNTAGGKFVFAKNGIQALALSNINTTAAPFNMEVLPGSTLNMGSNILTPSSGFFTLNSGAGLITSHASGINGNLTNTGVKTLNVAANYTFNGSGTQVTGALLPASVNNLTVNNSAGVSLTSPVTVNGILNLTTGTLSLGANNLTIGGAGSISGAGSGKYIVTDGAAKLNITAASGVATLFPIGVSTSSYDPATLTPATATNIAVNVGTTLPAVAPLNYTYNTKVWDITPTTPSSTVVTLTPSTAVATSVADVIGHYDGSAYLNVIATKLGNDYTATFTSFSPFVTGTTNLGTSVSQIEMKDVTFDGQIIHNNANLDLQIYDMTGRKVLTSNKDINMSSTSKGIYIVKSINGTLKITLVK